MTVRERTSGGRWVLLAPLVCVVPGAWWLLDRALAPRDAVVRERPEEERALAPQGLIAAAVAEATALAFAWPADGRIPVRAEHRDGDATVHESFELAWRTLAGGELLVETHALDRASSALPGPMRIGGAARVPVQAVIGRDGRFLGVPHLDDLRALWDDTTGHHAEDPTPQPLAEVWADWVERWVGVALAPGETRAVSTGNETGRATVACERLDTESVRLVWRLRRSTAAGDAEHGPLAHEHERTVTAELWTDGLRPRSIKREARWIWRTETRLVRVLERSSRYELDWAALQPGVAGPEEADDPPAEIASWSERCWPELGADELEADARWWRTLWPRLTPARREQLAASVGSAPPGHGRATREGWLRVRSRLERLWLAPDPLAPAELPVRTWVEHAPREAAVDVLLVGDGYAADELAPGARYEQDVERIASGMLTEPPLAWYRDWFNVRVAYLESPRFALETPLRVRQEGRSLIVDDTMRLAQVVRTAGDADIVLVVANRRGCAASGGQLYTSARSGVWRAAPVMSAGCPDLAGTALHEIGHSLADLADEYEDSTGLDLERRRRLEAPNMIAGQRPSARYAPWLHFLALPGAEGLPWMHEGAYYRSEGFWRPWPFCRMRDSSDPFCPVCSEAIARAVFETCGLPFNDELFHEAHPLERWKR